MSPRIEDDWDTTRKVDRCDDSSRLTSAVWPSGISVSEQPVRRVHTRGRRRKGSRLAWRALLAKIDLQLPFNERSNLSDEETARTLFACTNGNLRRLRKIFHIAVVRALGNKGKLLTWDDLAAGYHRLPKMPDVKGNPFDRNGLFK